MSEIHVVAEIHRALALHEFPAITRWNRLEGRPRTHHFDRALRAEVRDAMWMLSRQWQLGEFIGDDAGSPVIARACLDLRPIDRYQPGDGAVESLDAGHDLIEPRVERRPVALAIGDQYLALDLRMAVGRRWLRLLRRDFPGSDYPDQYLAAYAVAVADPDAEADRFVCAHTDAWQQVGCAAERAVDGVRLLDHIAGGGAASDGITLAAAGDAASLSALADRLRAWFATLVERPDEADAWQPSRLEYRFGVSAPSGDSDAAGGVDVVLRAPEYASGSLDWYALERGDEPRLDPADVGAVVDPELRAQTFLPTQVVFDGMPSTRWWAFEDRRTNFGQVAPDTTDVGKLMLMEFALVFANDWFVVPWTLPIGSLARVHGIAVTTVFDERLWVEPVVQGGLDDLTSWSMFTLSPEADGRASDPPELALLPVAPHVLEGEPLEDVSLIRDEMANMVWAIEHRIPLPTGWPRSGSEAGAELRAFLEKLPGVPPSPPPAPAAPIRYTAMTGVPEEWIPFIPVHVEGSSRETQLQRAAMPRFLENRDRETVEPRTPLLRENLPAAYFVHEEEVPRAGVRVTQRFQRARRPDGGVVVWYGARKAAGRGEGSSGLAFDRITPTE